MPIQNLDEFKSAVKDLEGFEDLITFHLESVEAEKTRGISEKRRANDEAKGLRSYKKAFTVLGLEQDADLDEFLDALQDKLEAAKDIDPKAASEMEQQFRKLKRDFEKSQTQLTESNEKATRIKRESDHRTLTSKITDSIRDKVYGPDLVADNLISNGKVALEDDGTVSWIEGEERGSFDDGIKSYIDSRPDIVKNGQRGGAGSTPGSGAGAGTKTLSYEQIEGMSKDEIKANLSDIKKSYGIK